MSGTVIYVPPAEKHKCDPPMETRWIQSPLPNKSTEPIEEVPALGTLWRCDCDKIWKVVRQPYRNVFPDRKWAKAGPFTQLKVWWSFL